MSPATRQIHRAERALALYASGDLNAWELWRVRRHVAQCALCGEEVEAFHQASSALAAEAEALPADIHWGKFAAEMRANIHLGIEAGQIAGPDEERPVWVPWRAAAAMAAVAVLVLGGFWLNQPMPRRHAESARGVVLRTTTSGIELDENGGSLALMQGGGKAVTLAVGTQSSLNVRYLDEDTGEVTIHHVYSQ